MKAMILAAGRGERMRPLTDHVPKPLLHVGGRPLIVWQIERLVSSGFPEIVINVSWLADEIESALGNGSRWGASLVYSREEQALETAGGIRKVLSLFDGSPFLVVNGDVYSDYSYDQLGQAIMRLKAGPDRAHLVLVKNPEHHWEGDFGLQNGRLIDRQPYFTFSGISVWHPEAFTTLTPGEKVPLVSVIRNMMANGVVSGEFYAGKWADIGTTKRLAMLDKILT